MFLKYLRLLLCVPLLGAQLLWASLSWAASPQQKIEDLSLQVAPLWQTLKPVCVMAVQADLQPSLQARLDYLDEQLLSSNLISRLVEQVGPDTSTAWSSQVWAFQEQLEQAALDPLERESLREYYFKLQTQTPGKHRARLVAQVQYMSEELNMVLRQQIWKSCHALGLTQLTPEQLEEAVQQRWLLQSKRVKKQLHDELAAFYFYSFRTVENTELTVIANLSSELNPWVETSKLSIEAYFTNLRAQLVNYPLMAPSPLMDEPFPAAHPWDSAPVQGSFIRP